MKFLLRTVGSYYSEKESIDLRKLDFAIKEDGRTDNDADAWKVLDSLEELREFVEQCGADGVILDFSKGYGTLTRLDDYL